jgi:hypothetical protein
MKRTCFGNKNSQITRRRTQPGRKANPLTLTVRNTQQNLTSAHQSITQEEEEREGGAPSVTSVFLNSQDYQ